MSVDTFHSVGVDTDIVTGVDPYIIQIIDFDLNTDNIIPPSGFREETSKMTSKTSIQLVKPLGERFYLCSTVAGKPLLWKDDNRKISPNITIYQNMSVTLYKPKTVEENNYTYLRSDHVQILPTNLPTKAMDNTAMEDLVATFYKDRKLTTLETLNKEDQEIIIRLIKVFPAVNKQDWGTKSACKVVDRSGGRAMFFLKYVTDLEEGRSYKVTGMKRLTRIFVSTKDTRFQLQQDDDLTWAEFGEVVLRAKVEFVSDISIQQVCWAHYHQAASCSHCTKSPSTNKSVKWTMTGVMVVRPLLEDGTGDAADDVEDVTINVDGTSLFGPELKLNDLNRLIAAAQRMEGLNYEIHYDIWAGKNWAAIVKKIE